MGKDTGRGMFRISGMVAPIRSSPLTRPLKKTCSSSTLKVCSRSIPMMMRLVAGSRTILPMPMAMSMPTATTSSPLRAILLSGGSECKEGPSSEVHEQTLADLEGSGPLPAMHRAIIVILVLAVIAAVAWFFLQ